MKGGRKIAVKFSKETKDRIKRKIADVEAIRTGDLLRSIDYELKMNGEDFEVDFFMIDYGKFVDEGTKYIRPREFFVKVIEQETRSFEKDLEDEIEAEIYKSIDIKKK